jgi:hypothetical protein
MLLKQFKRTGPLTVFLIVIVLILLWIGAFLKLKEGFSLYFDLDPMPLYGVISDLTGTHPVPGLFLSFILLSVMIFLMVNLNTVFFFINERTFLPALFYILLSGLFPQYQLLNPAIISALFLMMAIKRIMESYRVQGTAYSFFDAGILISVGSLFYINLIWFGLITFIGILLLRPFNFKEILLSIIGLLTPFILAIAIYYVLGRDPFDFLNIIVYNMFEKEDEFAFNPFTIAGIAFTGLLMLMAITQLFMVIGTKKIQSRKVFSVLLWIFIISVVVYFLIPSVSIEMIWITAIPVSYYLSHYMIFVRRKVITEVLFDILLLLVIVIQLWDLKVFTLP